MVHQAKTHEKWMALALQEAAKALGKTSPNPMVGAVLVKNNRLLAKGFHHRAGSPHAEIEVLKKVKLAKGAILYVTLEPCCHRDKRTPPCVDALIDSGIKQVVVATLDPNPKVAGKGVRRLRRAGINVSLGIGKAASRELNRYYHHWMALGIPWLVMKSATSLDGKIALANGKSQWITNEVARKRAHQLRSEVDAILVGIGTVQQDDPKLTVRYGRVTKQPIRLVIDPDLKILERAKVLQLNGDEQCWVLTSPKQTNSRKAGRLQTMGVECLSIPVDSKGRLQLRFLLKLLGKRGVLSLLLEGGPGVWTEFYRRGLVDELYLFLAPKILGGDGRDLLGSLSLKQLPKPFGQLHGPVESLDSDLLLRYRFKAMTDSIMR